MASGRIITLFLSKGGLGEVVLQTPFYRALKTLHPGSRVEAFVNERNRCILANNPHIDALHSYRTPLDLIGNLLALRRGGRFDRCFVFDKSWKGNLLARTLIAADNYRGFLRNRLEALPLDFRLPYDASRHDTRYYLDLLPGADPAASLEPELFPSEHDRVAAEAPFPVHVPRPLVAMLAGGASNPAVGDEPFRRWAQQNYLDLGRELALRECGFLLAGGPGDAPINKVLSDGLREAGARVIDVTGKLTPVQSALALGKADCIVCHDSGLMHLSSCFNPKLVCLFGPTSPHTLLPQVAGVRWLWADQDIYDPRVRVHGTRVLQPSVKDQFFRRLTVEMVFEAVCEAIWGKKKPR